MRQIAPKPLDGTTDVLRGSRDGSVRGGWGIRSVGLVLHPQRDSAEAVEAIVGWATRQEITVFGVEDEIRRLDRAAVPVTAGELGRCCDLVVSLGGDGTMLRAMRLADRQRARPSPRSMTWPWSASRADRLHRL